MRVEELRDAVRDKWVGNVWTRERFEGTKAIVVCGQTVPGGPKKKAYEKAISFNVASIPEDALAKIEEAIR